MTRRSHQYSLAIHQQSNNHVCISFLLAHTSHSSPIQGKQSRRYLPVNIRQKTNARYPDEGYTPAERKNSCCSDMASYSLCIKTRRDIVRFETLQGFLRQMFLRLFDNAAAPYERQLPVRLATM